MRANETKENEEEKKCDLEIIRASISDHLNITTGHEPHDWPAKREMVKRQLGVYLVKAFCKVNNQKDKGLIITEWDIDVEKMEEYLAFHKKTVGEKDEV